MNFEPERRNNEAPLGPTWPPETAPRPTANAGHRPTASRSSGSECDHRAMGRGARTTAAASEPPPDDDLTARAPNLLSLASTAALSARLSYTTRDQLLVAIAAAFDPVGLHAARDVVLPTGTIDMVATHPASEAWLGVVVREQGNPHEILDELHEYAYHVDQLLLLVTHRRFLGEIDRGRGARLSVRLGDFDRWIPFGVVVLQGDNGPRTGR